MASSLILLGVEGLSFKDTLSYLQVSCFNLQLSVARMIHSLTYIFDRLQVMIALCFVLCEIMSSPLVLYEYEKNTLFKWCTLLNIKK